MTVQEIKNVIYYVVFTNGYDGGKIVEQISNELKNNVHQEMTEKVDLMNYWCEEKQLSPYLSDFEKKALKYWGKPFLSVADYKMVACCVNMYIKENKIKTPSKRITFTYYKYEMIGAENYQFDYNGETVFSGYHSDDMYTYKIYGNDGNVYMWHSSARPSEMDKHNTITASVKSRKTDMFGETTITITRGSLK